MDRGKFIVIEGTEGVGKTTQSRKLKDKIEGLGLPVYLTTECSDGPIGRLIRQMYLSGQRKVDRRLINYLYTADRLDHITNSVSGMMHQVQNGINVITDRYYLSSLAIYPLEYFDTPEYMNQMKFIMQLNQTAYELLPPDMTIVIQADPDEIDKRFSGRTDKIEIYDNNEDVTRSIASYRDAIDLCRQRGETIIEVDGIGSEYDVHQRIWSHVSKLLTT